MMVCKPRSLRMVIHPLRSQSPTEWNKALCWWRHCSAWCAQRCWQMPYRTPTQAEASEKEQTKSSSTYDVSKTRPRSTLIGFKTSCWLMTVPSMLVALSSTACNNFTLTISTKKTAVMYQPAPGKTYQEPTVTVSGQRLAAVGKFMYLGSTLSRCSCINEETDARISKASSAFGCLRSLVWGR